MLRPIPQNLNTMKPPLYIEVPTTYANGEPTHNGEKILTYTIINCGLYPEELDSNYFLNHPDSDSEGWMMDMYPPMNSMIVSSDFKGKPGDTVQFYFTDQYGKRIEFAPVVELTKVQEIRIWKDAYHIGFPNDDGSIVWHHTLSPEAQEILNSLGFESQELFWYRWPFNTDRKRKLITWSSPD